MTIQELEKYLERLKATNLDLGSGKYKPKDLVVDFCFILPMCIEILDDEIQRRKKNR